MQVMQGANCWTDHSMVKCRVRISLFHSGMMGCCCLISRPLVFKIVGILSAKIGCIEINYVILRFGKWHIPEDRIAVLLTYPHKG